MIEVGVKVRRDRVQNLRPENDRHNSPLSLDVRKFRFVRIASLLWSIEEW
jgi:hypothetical protein